MFKPWLFVFGHLHHFTTLRTEIIVQNRRNNREQNLEILRIHEVLKTSLLKQSQTGAEQYVQQNIIARGPLNLFHPLCFIVTLVVLRTQN